MVDYGVVTWFTEFLVGIMTSTDSIRANNKLRDAVLWFGTAAIVLTLSGLAFWGATMAREGIMEGIFPWQLLKLRRLLFASSAWLAFVGLATPISYLFRGRFARSRDSS